LRGDFTNFVKEKVESGYDIHWSLYKDNSPVPAYKDIINLFDGTWGQSKDDAQILDFHIPGQTNNATLQVAPPEDPTSSKSFSSSGLQSPFHASTMVSHGGRLSGVAGQKERNNIESIESATIQELIDGNDNPNFYHRAQHLAATKVQGDPVIMRTFANTVELRIKSEHFSSNNTYYSQWVMLKDFKSVAAGRFYDCYFG